MILAALLLLAAAATAGLSPWLLLAGAVPLVLTAINAYRDRIEQAGSELPGAHQEGRRRPTLAAPPETVIAYIDKRGRFVRMKERS